MNKVIETLMKLAKEFNLKFIKENIVAYNPEELKEIDGYIYEGKKVETLDELLNRNCGVDIVISEYDNKIIGEEIDGVYYTMDNY